MKKSALLLLKSVSLYGGFLMVGGVAQAQTIQTPTTITPIAIPAPGTTYTQDFNALAATGTSSAVPAGFGFAESGTGPNALYTAATGTATAGDTYSFGSTAGATDRAFGALQSGAVLSRIGAVFTNNTSGRIASITISYTGEQYRVGTANRTERDRLDFQYRFGATDISDATFASATDVDALDFVAPIATPVGALDGNLAANRTPKTATITFPNGLGVGQTIAIRFLDFNASGADDGLAIDDFSLSATAGTAGTGTAPVANPDTATVNEDSTGNVMDVLANDTDADAGDTRTVTAVSQGSRGGTVAIGDGNANVVYTPAANVSGTETFSYTITDSTGNIATATVTVTITNTPDVPVAVADTYSTAFNTALTVAARGVLLNDTDPDPGTTLTAVKVSDPTNGTLTLNSDGSFTYTPTTGFSGPDSFTYKANDGGLDSNVVTVTLNVAAPPSPPSTTLVISEVYGGGGNAGAPFTNDFIEIYNLGTTSIDLSDYSVQYAPAAGSAFVVTPLSGTIAPGAYYLVQQASGGSVGAPLPPANVTGTINLAATNGRVALVSSKTAVTGPTDLSVVDFVGFGTATQFETGAAPAGSNTTSVTRTSPATDTNNNSADFKAVAPTPQTTTPVAPSSPTAYAVVGNSLYSFPVSSPASATLVGAAGAIGFAPEGIDFNPANGQLYALDVESAPGVSSLYTLNLTTGAATLVGSFASAGAGNGSSTGSALNSYDLTGQQIGFDFNPKTLQGDGSIRIRVTAQNGSDIRLNSANGAVAGVDGRLNGAANAAVGSAYTNNFAQMGGAQPGGATTLYNVAENDTLYLQNPPNNGTLATVGPLGVDIKAATGFDIFSGAGGNIAYLASDVDASAGSEFFTVDLATGTATAAGNFGALAVSDIAVAPAAAGEGAPLVRSITRAAGTNNPTGASSISFLVTFTEAVTGVDAADFTLFAGVGISGASISGVSGSGATYTVTVGGFTGNGNIRLDVADNDTVVDGAGNPLGGTGAGNGSFVTGEVIAISNVATSGAIISEFRFHGKTGPADEFVEIYNTLTTPLNIGGWKIRTNTGNAETPVFQTSTVPADTFVPARGHYLFTGAGYSLGAYGTGNSGINGTTPNSGDAADDSGVALFNAAQNPETDAPIDAVGFVSSAFGLREAGSLASAPTSDNQYSFTRDFNVSLPRDTGNSSADYVLVVSDADAGNPAALATIAGTGGNVRGQLGAPSPEGLTSPVYSNNQVTTLLLDPNFDQSAPPNRVRTGAVNSGTILVRRTIVNKSGRTLTRVRFTVTRITALGAPIFAGNTAANQADVRLISSSDEPNVAMTGGTINVFGTRLEAGAGQPAQPLGGGLGSSLSFDAVLSTPLLNNESRSYGFLLQVVKSGNFTVALNIEALPNP